MTRSITSTALVWLVGGVSVVGLAGTALSNVWFFAQSYAVAFILLVVSVEALKCGSLFFVSLGLQRKVWGLVAAGLLAVLIGYGGSAAALYVQIEARWNLRVAEGETARRGEAWRAARLAAITRELADITTRRAVAEIEADIDKVVSDTRANKCETLDGVFSRAHCPRVYEWRSELEKAKQRDRLTAERDELSRQGVNVDPRQAPDPLVVLLQRASGYEATTIQRLLPLWTAILLELVIVVCSVLFQMSNTTKRCSVVTERCSVTDPVTDAGARIARPVTPGHARSRLVAPLQHEETPVNTAVAYAALADDEKSVIQLLAANGGRLATTQRGLGQATGMPKTRAWGTLHRLELNGWVRVETGATGTVVFLLRGGEAVAAATVERRILN